MVLLQSDLLTKSHTLGPRINTKHTLGPRINTKCNSFKTQFYESPNKIHTRWTRHPSVKHNNTNNTSKFIVSKGFIAANKSCLKNGEEI